MTDNDSKPITEEDYWACACYYRHTFGALSHIKLHHPSVAVCLACGGERPEYGQYLCESCDTLITRDSDEPYITTTCETTGEMSRAYRI